MQNTRTKIVCTIGPSSWEEKTLRALVEQGMDVVRINMAHGTYAEHAKTLAKIRKVARELDKPLAIEVDLQGPKIRVGNILDKGLELIEGERLVFSTNPELAKTTAKDLSRDKIFVQYPNLHKDVDEGARLLLADGKMSVKVVSIDNYDIVCEVVIGGKLASHKGINFPNTTLSIKTITDKDIEDLKFALKQDVEWVGLSFVRVAQDILELRELIKKLTHNKQPATKITAKIETHEALDDLEEIVKISDGVVIARGDLGPEVSITSVPENQKRIVDVSRKLMKPVIVATQMLYSMTENPRPTRAEVSDVANAVFEHVDGIYLSDETASGKFPVEAVRMANSIIADAEKSAYDDVLSIEEFSKQNENEVLLSLSHHAAKIASEVKAKAIVVTTVTGQTAIAVSAARQEIPLIAVTAHRKVQRQLELVWGIEPIMNSHIASLNTVNKDLSEYLHKNYQTKKGDKVVFVDGVTKDKREGENLIRVLEM